MSDIFRIIAIIGLVIAASSAQAQSYRCSSGSSTYISDRPCVGDANRTQLGAYGPARTRTSPSYASQLPAAPRAQQHTKYLPSGCSAILEAIRTAPARGVRNDVISGLREEYAQKCAFDDQEARNQLRQEQSQQRQARVTERDGALKERQQAKLQADGCANMRDVIALKRQRESTLNAVEVGALRDLEKAYNGRCLGR